MKAKVLKGFYDKEAGHVYREPGETFELTQARLAAINAAGHGELVEKVAAPRKKKTEGAEG